MTRDTARAYTVFSSPIGELLLSGRDGVLTSLHMQWPAEPLAVRDDWRRDDTMFAVACAQLEEYFAGARTEFDIMLEPAGTDFQRRVWRALRAIPYGSTTSYGALARSLGSPDASRAVGMANGRNPIAIIIPCHRVIGADGSLTGYGGGLDRKRWLLDHEAAVSAPIHSLPLFSTAGV